MLIPRIHEKNALSLDRWINHKIIYRLSWACRFNGQNHKMNSLFCLIESKILMINHEKLTEAKRIADRIRSIRKEINASYNTYHSPRFDGIKNSTKTADPVTSALNRIDNLNDELADCCEQLIPFLDELMQIPNSVIRTIIVERYLLGYSWKKCTQEALGIRGSDYARIRLYKYLKKHQEEIS